jgi:hypothetical protein
VLVGLWEMSRYQRSSRDFEHSDTRRPCAIPGEGADHAVADIAESTPCCLYMQLIVVEGRGRRDRALLALSVTHTKRFAPR